MVNLHDDTIETLDILSEMSQLLNCGLNKESLSICIGLLENGANPEALASVINEIKSNNIITNNIHNNTSSYYMNSIYNNNTHHQFNQPNQYTLSNKHNTNGFPYPQYNPINENKNPSIIDRTSNNYSAYNQVDSPNPQNSTPYIPHQIHLNNSSSSLHQSRDIENDYISIQQQNIQNQSQINQPSQFTNLNQTNVSNKNNQSQSKQLNQSSNNTINKSNSNVNNNIQHSKNLSHMNVSANNSLNVTNKGLNNNFNNSSSQLPINNNSISRINQNQQSQSQLITTKININNKSLSKNTESSSNTTINNNSKIQNKSSKSIK